MYFNAMRLASTAIQKQSAGVAAASTGMGASELRPYSACRRSACSVLVGRPVEGPPRWISQTTSGSSTATARPSASVLSAMPGPEVVENIGSRRDGIRAEKERNAGLLGCGDEAESQRGIAADVAINAGSKLRRRNLVTDVEGLSGFAIAIAGLEGEAIGLGELRLALEFVLNPAERALHGAVVEPIAHAQGEEILAA